MKNINENFNILKASYPDAILLFRVENGNTITYESFYGDAQQVSSTLNIPCTLINGVYHSGFKAEGLEGNLRKLIKEGFKVAVVGDI